MEEIPPVPVVTGGMVRRIQGKRGKKMGGGRETSDNGSYFPAAHLLPPWSHTEVRTIPPRTQ